MTDGPGLSGRKQRLGRGGWALIAVLLVLLAVALVFAVRAWTLGNTADAAGGNPISFAGALALVLGALGTAALGAGLMALAFFSARSGHDAAVHGETWRTDPGADAGGPGPDQGPG